MAQLQQKLTLYGLTMGALVCWALAAITFVAIALLRIPLAWVLLVVGGMACAWAYRQLGRITP